MSDANLPEPHVSVLLDEAVNALRPARGGRYIDGTFGRGGHTRALLKQLPSNSHLLAFDKDPEAINAAHSIADARFQICHASYTAMAATVARLGWPGVDGVLLDLGISSPQIDDPERGFSFRFDGPLDMRMDPSHGASASDVVNTATEQQLIQVIRDYGEERFAVQVAKAIVARRRERPFGRTRDLAEVVARAVKTREPGQDPATRTFQALRIHVNQELEELPIVLDQAMRLLNPEGRLSIISFHSLEDRIVKRYLQQHSRLPERFARLPLRECELPVPLLCEVARVFPSAEEIARNPRARSAVLRTATRTAAPWREGEA